MRSSRSIFLGACALLMLGAGQAATSPWFGTWKLRLKNAAEKPETLIFSDAGGGAMRMVSLEDKSELVTHFDGKPAADVGTGADRGTTLAIVAASPISYNWTLLKAGKPYVRGRNVLAEDRRSFTEVSWLVTEPENTKTFVYERQ